MTEETKYNYERNLRSGNKKRTGSIDLTDWHSLYTTSKYSKFYSSASGIDAGDASRGVEDDGRSENVPKKDGDGWSEAILRPDRLMAVRENEGGQAKWVSPVDANKRRWVHAVQRGPPDLVDDDEDPLGKCPDSSFDLNSSLISLDFGLISPKRNWSSPPQRIERAQNREWSPHRVIDRPNPENSPGNWISVKESCQQSPLPPPPTTDIKHAFTDAFADRLPQELRPSSQSTYIVPETITLAVPLQTDANQLPTRKTCVLMDYVPDRGTGGDTTQAKKRTVASSEPLGSFPLTTSEAVKRVVEPGGRVVKTSLLDDYQVPALGRPTEKVADDPEKGKFSSEPPPKMIKTNFSVKLVNKENRMKTKTVKLTAAVPSKGDVRSDAQTLGVVGKAESAENVVSSNAATETPHVDKEDDSKKVANDTKKIITDLENILRDKPTVLTEVEKKRKEKLLARKTGAVKSRGEPEPEVCLGEKKKRNVDTKGVQEFIRNQKQRRVEMLKANKKTKVEEKETIKKNLEELRVRTLKLAAVKTKKKKPSKSTIKIVDPGAEDDITMSLGLKQVKPRVSYNESVSNLKKKTPRTQAQQQVGPETSPDHHHSEKEEEREEKISNEPQGILQSPQHLHRQENHLHQVEAVKPVTFQPLAKPSVDSIKTVDANKSAELNATLKKLAEALHLKIAEEKSQLRSKPPSIRSKPSKDPPPPPPPSRMPCQQPVQLVSKDHAQMITIDLDTIYSLKEDIKKISENFKVLHEIIVEKADLNDKKTDEKTRQDTETQTKVENKTCADTTGKTVPDLPQWLQQALPKPHPYSVYTAFRRKMHLESIENSMLSVTSQETSSYAETASNKNDSEFEALSLPSDRLQPSVNEIVQRKTTRSTRTTLATPEQNYSHSLKDSGSELSSSILDSENQIFAGSGNRKQTLSSIHSSTSGKNCQNTSKTSMTSSSVVTEITSKNIPLASLKGSFISAGISPVNFDDDQRNLSLTTPDVKLVSKDSGEGKVRDCSKKLNLDLESAFRQGDKLEVNNSGEESKSDSTITESGKCQQIAKATNKKFDNVLQRTDESQQIRRTFFQPEMLHLQFQAELTLLETFQQSLSHFLEAERVKTLTEVTKIVYEKSVNTDKALEREDQAVQTTFLAEDSIKTERKSDTDNAETDSIATDLEISDGDSIKSVKTVSSVREMDKEKEEKSSEISEKIEQAEEKRVVQQGNTSIREKEKEKEVETPDLSAVQSGISFQMLERMIKDEELRSEHQLALIRLREKTLNEKVKAELTFLEMKKRALKEGGTDEDQNVSALKKRQRGILLRYQSEKEEIERLKKMHKIASEERKIMMKQQKQIQQMQLTTKDVLSKLRRREKSPQKRSPIKTKVSTSYGSQSDIEEDLRVQMSDSILTESVASVDGYSENSQGSDFEISSEYNASDAEGEGHRKKGIKNGIGGLEMGSMKSKKCTAMEPEKHPRKRHSVDELIIWTRRLEEKENRLRELERKAAGWGTAAKNRFAKPSKCVKGFMKDRSTSPFQFPESLVSPTDHSTSISEVIEAKNSPTITEALSESIYNGGMDNKKESLPTTMPEGLPPQFSKIGSTTVEYYSESFESPSSWETPKLKALDPRLKPPARSDSSYKSIPIKLSLSPRIRSPRRRNSSGSDDSQNFSHTETASEQSDLESRIAALHEQLRKRKLEAEKLRREQKKAQRERLKVKEQSLLKQIQAYDAYIQRKKQELEQEYEHSSQAISKPLIKQPKVAEKSNIRRQEPLLLNETKFHSRVTLKTPKEKDLSPPSRKITESDSEIQEQIKEASEQTLTSGRQSSSLIEQIETKLAEEGEGEEEEDEEEEIEEEHVNRRQSSDLTESKEISSSAEVEKSCEATAKGISSNTASGQSVPEPDMEIEASVSESEDLSTSIKTTVQSPEKQDTEVVESREKTEAWDEGSKENVASTFDNTYLSDSFESDFEEKSGKTQRKSEESELLTDISGSGTQSTRSRERQVLENVKGVEASKEKTESMGEMSSGPEEVGTPEQSPNRMANAEIISNSIILDLLTESLRMFSSREMKIQNKVKEEFRLNREMLASVLAKGIIAETIDDMFKIYNRKMDDEGETMKGEEAKAQNEQDDEEPISPEKITSDIRRRICEIMSQASGVKDQRRPQDMMVTTYDVTPTGTPPPEEGNKSDFDEKEEFLRSLTSTPKENKSSEVFPPSEPIHQGTNNDAFGQEWFENDFGLSRTRREAEQLRLQQIQIEQEIEQLKAQQEQIPYYYLREIPNKPPPPYTPPGKGFSEIPTSESDILSVTSMAVDILTKEMKRGTSVEDVEPPRDFFGTATSGHVKCYKTFLFDLARHMIQEVLRIQDKRIEKVLPWNRVREPLSVYKYNQIERTEQGLNEHVRKRVLVLFGFGRKIGRESLMMRCFKKKRDHVDEILVCEAQEEESQWTQFDEDHVAVKNEVALAILDGLLLESAQLLNVIFKKKAKRFES